MKTRSFVLRSRVPAPREAVWAWHERPGALARLSPPWDAPRVLEHGGIRDGARAVLSVSLLGPIRGTWVAQHEAVKPGHSFRDVQTKGPFARWVHDHSFTDGPDGTTWVEDRIEYALPTGAGLAANSIARRLARVFAYRHAVLAGDLARHAAWNASPRTIAVTGASGFVGSALVPFLTTGGHVVKTIGRGPGSDIRWDQLDALEGVDAVIHLAGESVASGRWTAAKKRRILESRENGTRNLVAALGRLAKKPAVLVSASAIGYYGDRGDEVLDECSAPGKGFLAEVCQAWEREALAAGSHGIRVVTPRIGIVLGAAGGALARMLPPFQAGAGGPLGDGRAWSSWIALDDLIGVLAHGVFSDLRGAVNAVAPSCVPNVELARAIGRVLHRPAVMAAPRLALRVALGEVANEVLLASQRVVPAVLERAGFAFRHPDLEDALRFELGRRAVEQAPHRELAVASAT